MTTQFSYQSLRCIVEYLEANKRIHITSRSKSLRKFKKQIPFHVNQLEVGETFIDINNICYYIGWRNSGKVLVDGVLRDWEEVLMPGDISLESVYPIEPMKNYFNLGKDRDLEIKEQKPTEMEFSTRSKSDTFKKVGRTIPISSYLPLKFLTNTLLGQRTTIYVSKLAVYDNIVRLPTSINLRIRDLGTLFTDFRGLLPIIDPNSFPLKHLAATPSKPELFHHSALQTAQTLTTFNADDLEFLEPWDQMVLTLPHKHITLESTYFSEEKFIGVTRSWLENPKAIGRTLEICEYGKRISEVLIAIKKEFNGRVVMTPKDETERSYHKAILIPINSTSELLVSNGRVGIKLETVAVGSITTKDGLDLNNWDLYFEDVSVLCVLILSIALMTFLLAYAYVLNKER